MLEGRDLDPEAAAPEVLVGPALAEEHGVGIGDTLMLSRPPWSAEKRCEDGVLVPVDSGVVDAPVARAFEVVGVLTREGVGRSARGSVVVVDFDAAAALYSGVPIQTRFWAVKDPSIDLERLQRSLASSYSYALNRGVVVGQAAEERAFRTGIRMLGLLALVLGLYVIFHTLSMSLTERVLEVGTLHASARTARRSARLLHRGCAALRGRRGPGRAARGRLARLATRVGITTLGVGKAVLGFHVPWGTVGALTAVGFLVALVGSVYPLVAIGGADTVAALRGRRRSSAAAPDRAVSISPTRRSSACWSRGSTWCWSRSWARRPASW